MAGIKISDLPAAASALLTDVFPIDQLPGPVTYKESNSQLLTLFKANGEALTKTDDTNVTMTLGGTPTTALLNASSMTLGWTGTLSGTRGGTGVNNGASTITLGGSLTTSGAFASTFTMTGATSVTFPTSGTLATTGGTVSSVTGTANRITSTGGTTPVIDISAAYVGQTSITTVGALAAGSLAAGFTPVTVPLGGTGNTTFTAYSVICAGTTASGAFQNVVGLGSTGEQLTSNGAGLLPTWQAAGTVSPLTTKGDIYTFTTVNARLPVGTTNGQILQVSSGAASGLAWSTATYPVTTTTNEVLYSSSSNVVAGVPVGSPGFLLTLDASSVPVWATPPASAVVGNASAFFLDTTVASADNLTLSTTPSVYAETINSKACTAATSPVFFERFNSGALGRTSIPAGVWTFFNYLDASSVAGSNVCNMRVNRRVLQTGLTGTFTGAGATRTFTVTGGTPFVAGDANPSRLLAGLIETPTQTAWISAFTSSSIVTVTLTDPAFVNVAGVTLTAIYYFMFSVNTIELSSTAVTLYTTTTTQPAFTGLNVTDSLVVAYFGSTDGNRTLGLYYGGTSHFTYLTSPLITTAHLTGNTGGILQPDANSNFNIVGGTGISTAGSGSTITINASGGTVNSGTIGQIAYYAATGTAVSGENQVTLAQGGTNASLTASDGGIFYSSATAGAILSGTATAGQIIRSGASAAPSWSTTTYPATNAVSTFLYASSTNVMAALATANNGLPVTSNTGVPSILAGPGTTGNILQSNAAAAPSFSTATYPSTSGSTGTLLRSNGTNWVNSTSTYPDTNAVSTLLYASSSNVMAALATANSSVLVTSAGGVPSLSTALPASLTATNMNLTTPTLGVASATSINFGGSALSTYAASTSWTPTFSFSTPGNLSVVYNSRSGRYIRIGDVVYYQFTMNVTPTFSTSSGNATFGGLPFAVSSDVQSHGVVIPSAIIFTGILASSPSGGATTMLIATGATGAGSSFLTTAAFTTTVAFAIDVTGFYFV